MPIKTSCVAQVTSAVHEKKSFGTKELTVEKGKVLVMCSTCRKPKFCNFAKSPVPF